MPPTVAQAAALPVDAEVVAATHVVTATAAALDDVLGDAGWRRLVPACLPWGSPHAVFARRDVDYVWERFNVLTLTLDYVLAWAASPPGPSPAAVGRWWLQPQHRPLAPGLADGAQICFDHAAALTDDLMRGLTEVHSGMPTRVSLHHGPHEIDAHRRGIEWSICARPDLVSPLGCDPLPVLPPVLPELRPVPEALIWRVNRLTNCVALTFDACSTFEHGGYNAEVVRVLEAEQIEATLFIGGHWAELHPELVQRLGASPLFELGNHSYSHPHMQRLSPERQRQELLWTQYLIYSYAGVVPRYFRPPYGDIDMALVAEAARWGLLTVEYDVPAGDATLTVGVDRLVDWVGSRAFGGSVVIMHMNQPQGKTAQALPQIVARLRARGLRPCKVSETLGEPGLPDENLP